jgi:hypothetical protein
MFAVVSQRIALRFSFVNQFHSVDLFNLINEKSSSEMQALPNKLAQIAAFCHRFQYLSLRVHF